MRNAISIAAAALAAVLLSINALAASHSQKDEQNWEKMQEQAVHANDIMASTVYNFSNPIGRVTDLILNKSNDHVQYVLFETPYPWSFYSGEDGFVSFDTVDMRWSAASGLDLALNDPEVSQPPEKLKMKRPQIDDRMVSRIVGEEMTFSDGKKREVQDLLIQPKSGKVTHFIVEMNPEAVFSEEPRTVRAKNVSIDEEGRITADVALKEVQKQQDYDPDLL